MNDEEEYLDLVNENDEVIGKEKRSIVHEKDMHNYRAANAFIRNSKGELWIPRRGPHKHIDPLGLDMSMGGHVSSGETYEETFRREVQEELNLDIDTVPYKLVGYFKGNAPGLHAGFQKVFEIEMDTAPDYNPDDFIEYYWLKPEEVLKRIEEGEKAKQDLPVLIKLLYI